MEFPPALAGETASPPPAAPAPAEKANFSPLTYSAPGCTYGGKFLSIAAVDELTVRFELCSPEVAFLSKISFPAFSIYPAEWLMESGGGGKVNSLMIAPAGSGPYKVEEWVSEEELHFTANEAYWGDPKPKIKRLIFRWNLDDSHRLLELQTGTVQGIDSPNPEDYSLIQQEPDIRWIQRAPLSVAFLGMNNTYPPFDNQLVRQAVSLALDRQSIVDMYFPIGFELAEFFTPCIIPHGCIGEGWHTYDPERARSMLVQAGYPNGFQTQISYRNVIRGYINQPEQVAREIQSQLRANLNISAQLIAIDSPQYLQAAEDGLLPGLFLLGWGADYPDISNFLDTHFGDQATMMLGNPFNDILKPLRMGISTTDEKAREGFYTTANNAIREHVPLIPLAHGGWVHPQNLAVAVRSDVQGAYADPFGFERFSEMEIPNQDELVWMQDYEPLSLYCADETDSDSLRACSQVAETLYRYKAGTLQTEPALAESCEPNHAMTVWTCRLRPNVVFHDGSQLDAEDVARSFIVQWDAAHPQHTGRLGDFSFFVSYWGAFLNFPSP